MKKTIYDVASLSGVSIATVSRVINGTANVRPATAFKVVKAIDELSFVPDVNAVKLAKILAEYRAKRVASRWNGALKMFSWTSPITRWSQVVRQLER